MSSFFQKLSHNLIKIRQFFGCMEGFWVMAVGLLGFGKYELYFLPFWSTLAILGPHYLKTKGFNAATVVVSRDPNLFKIE